VVVTGGIGTVRERAVMRGGRRGAGKPSDATGRPNRDGTTTGDISRSIERGEGVA
jgi:hypothetical protein